MIHPIEKRPKRAGVWNIRNLVIEKIGPVIDEYVDWYAENGVSLPECYALDPSGWTEVLRKIQRAFNLASIENEDYGEFFEAKKIVDETQRMTAINALQDDIYWGFRLYGKHLNDLFDRYGPEQSR